jgi:predicted permease
MWRRSPGVVGVAVAGLGVAIAVSTSVFSILNGVAFKPNGIDDPSSVVRIYRTGEVGYSTSWPYFEYLHLRAASGVNVEAWLRERQPLFPTAAESDQSRPVSAAFVSGGYLPALTARVTAGRLLSPSDDTPGSPPVAVVSHGFWTGQMGQDPGAVGRTVRWNGVEVTIVGISAHGFRGPVEAAPDVWIPIAALPRLMGTPAPGTGDAMHVAVLARVAGTTVRQAEARLTAAVATLPPAGVTALAPARGVRFDAAEASLPRSKRGPIIAALVLVMGAMALLLVLACTNVANLLLANGMARRRELGVRIALGASRGRVVRQLLTESLSLGLLGGVAGLLLTMWLLPLLLRVAGAPATLDVSPDFNVLGFLVAVSMATGIGAGLLPARHAADGDVSSALKAGGTGSGRRLDRIRSTLIGLQAAASIVLVVLAALFTRGMVAATRVDIGFAADRLLTAVPTWPGNAGGDAGGIFVSTARERLLAVPGITAIALASFPPYGGSASVTVFNRPTGRYTITHNETTAGYFSTLGLRLLRGRIYTDAEVGAGAPVAVISDAVARDFFPGEDPVGQRLSRIVDGEHDAEIVGVVSNVITTRLRDRSEAAIYHPMRDQRSARLLIRTSAPASTAVTAVRGILQSIDPRVRLDIAPVTEGLERQLGEARVLASLASTFAAVALCLAIVGLHGVTAFIVSMRTQEITLRLALGATARDVLRLLLVESLRPVAIGLGVGVVVALGVGRGVAGALYGIGPADPLAFGVSIVILLIAAVVAIVGPARRASVSDPAGALKEV